jgi:hypothetical protein
MATGRTWAEVAHKKAPPALPTECTVNLELYSTPVRLPPSSSRYSCFLPLPVTFDPKWLVPTLSHLPNTSVGVVPRLDISLLEVCFANKEHQSDFLSAPFTSTHLTVQPLPPAGTPSQYVPIKLVNVPVLAQIVVESQLRSLWGQYGEVVALAPHTVKGLPLLTNRWDMVLKLSDVGKPLTAPPFFDILGFNVMASWPQSKACPRCKQTGHDSRSCPRRPSTKRSSAKKTTPPAPTPSLSLAADAAPRGTSSITQATTSDAADVVAPTSDPNISLSTGMDINDEDMADVTTSASTSTSTSAPIPTPTATTASPSGPTRMAQKDLLYLSPDQLKSLTQAVAPKHIDFEVFMKLSAEQQDAMPVFINIRSAGKPVAPSLRRTKSSDRKKK